MEKSPSLPPNYTKWRDTVLAFVSVVRANGPIAERSVMDPDQALNITYPDYGRKFQVSIPPEYTTLLVRGMTKAMEAWVAAGDRRGKIHRIMGLLIDDEALEGFNRYLREEDKKGPVLADLLLTELGLTVN